MNTGMLKAWHAEIASELSSARTDLRTLQAGDAAAAGAVRAAEHSCSEGQSLLAMVEEPSTSLRLRLRWLEDKRAEARRVHSHTSGQLQALRELILELEASLAQLDQVLKPTMEDAA